MKKKRFYKNKKRNEKWTEQPEGRKISFADKYADGQQESSFSKKPKKKITKQQLRNLLKGFIIAVLCFCIISVGYVIMDVHIIRHSMPEKSENVSSGVASVDVKIKAAEVQPLSFDAGTMLNSTIQDLSSKGYSCAAFDLKRDDGTIGYQSELATIEAYGAISSPATNLEGSVEIMLQNDILPVGRISAYKDNVASRADSSNAIMIGSSAYQDDEGFMYLNPDSEGTYNYIRSIVEEARGLGVKIFVIDNYDLPDELGDGYSDGFDSLSQKLYSDFGDEIKLYKAVSISVDGSEYKTIEDIVNGINSSENEVYYTTAEYTERVKTIYDNKDINYIIK